jgi:hypothetical protein
MENPFDGSGQPNGIEKWETQVLQMITEWEKPIRYALNRLGQTLWPPKYILAIIPMSSYRLRSGQLDHRTFIWWIEHDIPPHDRNECAAYRVQLQLDTQGIPIVNIQSGTDIYHISPLTTENLEANIVNVAQDAPLIIQKIIKDVGS